MLAKIAIDSVVIGSLFPSADFKGEDE